MRLIDSARRRFLRSSCLAALMAPFAARASAPAQLIQASDQAPGAGGVAHRLVYQCNHGEAAYYRSLVFSVSQLKDKHADNIDIVVTAYGPGIHLLAKRPKRPVPPDVVEKLGYLDLFGVRFHACGNTLHALGWDKADLLDFVEVVPIGAEDLMLLQEQGYSYLSW